MPLVLCLVACSSEHAVREPGAAPAASEAVLAVGALGAGAASAGAVDGALRPGRASAGELALAARAGAATGVDGLAPRALSWIRDELVRAARDDEAIAALRFSLPALTDAAQRDAARFLLGKLLVRRGDAAALEHLAALPAPFEPVEDLRLAYLARAQRLAGQDDAALATIETLLARWPRSEEVYALRVQAAQVLGARGELEAADALLERNRSAGVRVPRPLRAESLRTRVELWRERAPAVAERHARELLLGHPSEAAALRPGLPLSVEDLSASERFARADRLQRDQAYVEARELFVGLMDHPRHGYEASWRVAEISARWYRDDYAGARAIYEALGKQRGEYQGKLRYRIMQTFLKEHRYDEALAIAARFGRQGDGLFYRGWIPYRTRDCASAMPHLKAYGSGEGDSTVKGFYAWCFVREGRWEEAVAAFESLVEYGNPIVRGKAYYWQARALHELGRHDEARERLGRLHAQYPLTYYDVLAYQMEARWEGRDARASVVLAPLFAGAGRGLALDEAGPEAWAWPRLSEGYRARLERVRRLVELDELERARAAYADIRAATERAVPHEQRWAFIHFIGQQTGNHYHGWQKASGTVRAMSGDMPDAHDARWLVAYPRAYRALVESLAAEFGVPSYLVYAIMLQESRFRWYQISSWDAFGALQMIPKTAVRVADDLGLVYDRHTFMEPRVGFRYSVHYMAKHLALWKNLTLTAASYNGGPHKVERWMRDSAGEPMDVLVEEFGFDQSRHYCRKVAEHMLRYIYLYETDMQRRAELLDLMFPLAVDYGIPDDTGY